MSAESVLNRKALRDFHILERYEAGIELKGSEVKSIRAGKANISDAFARIENGEAFLFNADIQPYEKASHEIPVAKRVRKLLLHREEIDKLYGETQIKGRTIVVLKLYWKSGKLKAELGVGQGKVARDKHELARAKSDLDRFKTEVLTIQCDLLETAQIQSAVQQTLQHFRKIDILINNAGTIEVGPIQHFQLKDFDREMRLHFWAPY